MNISSTAGNVPYAKGAGQSDVAGELQRQKQALTRQLEALKSKPKNSENEQKAAEKQKMVLEKQIAAIDMKLQKTSSNKNGEVAKNHPVQSDELKEASKKNKTSFKNNKNIIDEYA